MRCSVMLSATLLLLAAACGEASVVLPEPLVATYVVPHHGAANVSVGTSVEIGFNDRLDPTSVTADSVLLESAGQRVAVDRVLSADDHVVLLVPDSVLGTGTQYNIVVAESVRGVDAGELGAPLRTRFRTAP